MTRFTQRRDGLSAMVPTPAPVTKLVMPVTKVRTGRPPLGQVAMTAAERQRRRRAALKSGEAAGRKKEPVAAHPQKSNRAIAAVQNDLARLLPEADNKVATETGAAFKTVARAPASGVPNDTPEKTIGLDGKSYLEVGLKSAFPTTGPRGGISGTSGDTSSTAASAPSASGTAEPARTKYAFIGLLRP
jgi:hypothetical protein